MARGGARNRSGPQMDPSSARSDRRGVSLSALPSEGYGGEVPGFPLLRRSVMRWEFGEKGSKYQVVDEDATELIADREAELWAWAWRTPQAVAWAREPWRWQSVAQWVRTSVICETSEATAADRGSVHRFADQIGLTPAGLKENGWQIAADEVAEARVEKSTPVEPSVTPQRRLRSVSGGGS